MKTRYPVLQRLLAAAMLAAAWQISMAAPAMKDAPKSQGPAKPMASKPKLTPRPVPGMSSAAAAAPAAPLTVHRAPTTTTSKTPAAPTGDETHILMIYRSGTFEPPPRDPAPAEPKDFSDIKPPGDSQPLPFALPLPGDARIISKAEADALAAQPHN